jgi:beta-glucanase (GH16 family)
MVPKRTVSWEGSGESKRAMNDHVNALARLGLGLIAAMLLGMAPTGGHANLAPRRGASKGGEAQAAVAPMGQANAGWVLTFHDEFDGTALDTSRWNDQYWHGRTHSNNELEYYAPDGYEVRDGRLRLKGERRAMGGRDYTSGMITSLGHFAQTYGYFEIRARFPKGKGLWPAFWLLPTTKKWPPEIDVLEILGHEPTKVYFSTHWRDEQGQHRGNTSSYTGPDFSADFHTFAAEWKPGEVIWYVDGVERGRSTAGVPAEPMYVIANLAIGGDWPGNPTLGTTFPGVMEIDYIRVYKHP